MIRVRLSSNRIIECDGYLEVVEAVKNESPFTENQSIEDYLKGISERLRMVYNIDILSLNNMRQIVNVMNDVGIIEILDKE